MKQFYESEMSDMTYVGSAVAETDISTTNLNKGSSLEKRRREMKKDPAEKQKEKVWEKIMKQAENDGQSSSDDDNDENQI